MSTLPTPNNSRVFASPLARRLALENNLELALISGSGPAGRVIKRDIERVLANPAANLNTAPIETQVTKKTTELPDPKLFFSEDEFSLEPISPMLQSIAKRSGRLFGSGNKSVCRGCGL